MSDAASASEQGSEQVGTVSDATSASEQGSEQVGTVSDAASASEPFLRVVKGDPTLDELAALVAVVAARRASAPFDPLAPRKRSAWGDSALAVRPVLHPGPGGWRRSVLPR